MLPEQVVVERPHQGADPTSHLSVFSTPAGVPLSLMADTALAQIHRRDDYAAAERAIGAREGDGPGTIWGRGGPVSVFSWASQGQRCGRYSVRRRAERMIRPAREKNRRRRVLVVTTCSPRPMRAVQRARLWAITCTASQAALAAKRHPGIPESGLWGRVMPLMSI